MTTFVPATLPIDLPELSAALAPDLDPALASDSVPEALRWWLGGRRVHAEFDAAQGLVEARFGGDAALAAITWVDAGVDRVGVAPRAARFRRSTPGGYLQETVRIPERLPGLVLEMSVEDRTSEEPIVGHLDIRLPGGSVPTSGDASSRWFAASETEGLLIVALGPDGRVGALRDPVSLEAGARVPFVVEGTELTLLVLAGEPASASLRSLAAVAAHQRRSAPAKEALRLREPVGDVAEAVEWGWTRVRDRMLEGVGPVPSLNEADLAVWVRTAIAAGLPDAARAVLAEVPSTVAEADAWEAWAAAVGAGGPIDGLEKRIGGGEELASDVRRRLADVADRAGSETWAADLRATEAAQARRVTLPSIGGAADTEEARDEPTTGGDPEAWLERTLADSAALQPDGWRVLGDLVEDVLGWSPDAASGRMHLTPTLPDSWPRFALEGLRGGELKMRLERIREGNAERWRFEPMAGAVPATLILRLPVPDRETPVEIDGVPAELDHDLLDGVLRVPIQIELDRERVVRVGGATGAETPGARRISLPTL